MKSTQEIILFYNTENFFSPDSKPSKLVGHSASGLRNWDQFKYDHKRRKIGNVFQLIKEKVNKLPFIIGLSEIQGENVLKDLLTHEVFQSDYEFIHYESMDERGVDVALLYDSSKIKILHSEPISYLFEIEDSNPENYDTTRDVLYTIAQYQQEILHIFVLHLPSKREKDINKPKRIYIAKDLQEKISKISNEYNESVIVLGDFNENPNENSMQYLYHDQHGQPLLENPFLEMYHQKKYSTFHFKEGLLFDQILVSKDFYNTTNPFQFRKSEVFIHPKLCSKQKNNTNRPYRTYTGTRYLGGYSDHFPVILTLDYTTEE